MTSRTRQAFYSPCWTAWDDDMIPTPIVDGKYIDPSTGELRDVQLGVSGGPPDVDIIVLSVHAETAGVVFRASRPFKMEHLLFNIAKVIHDHDLKIDSLTATPYAIRVVIAHGLTKEELSNVSFDMANGLFPIEHEQEQGTKTDAVSDGFHML